MSSDDLQVRIMDSDMAEPWNPDDMFESSAMPDSALDFTQFLTHEAYSSPAPGAAALANGYHSPAKPLASHREQTPALPQTHPTLQSRSTMSSSSPESSSQDSASETSGRRKRKLTSSDSSPNDNAFFDLDGSSANNWQRDELQMAPANSPRFDFSKWVKRESDESMGMDAEVDSVSRSMATAGFDYAASPVTANSEQRAPTRTIAPTDMNLANGASVRHGNGRTAPPTQEAQFLLGSRDPSPMSGISGSQGPSPAAMMEQDMFSANYTTMGDSSANAMPTTAWQGGMSPGNMANAQPSVAQPLFPQPILPQRHPNKLWIHQDGNKSRVETQINIRMTLFPCSENVTRLHLPTNSISKPKLMAKQRTKDANTLELHTHLVCASAMEKRENLLRALDRAASYESNDLVTGKLNGTNTYSAEDNPDDPEKPLNGGPIRICSNCVQRERKRAARKRVKKQEDEEQWAQYEYDRVIVFNDKEYKEWTSPAPSKPDSVNPQNFPAGAKQVEVPMRIACYCRHQQEKSGFQVIFTIKDHQNRVLAQSITCPILITDDHKTNSAPTANGMTYDNSQYNGAPSVVPSSVHDSDMQTTLARRPYHSTNDLPGLQSNWTSPSFNQNGGASHGSSSTLTPRHASRQTSPATGQHGPNKKRKSSSSTHSHKLPRELTMTTMTRVNNQASPPVSGDMPASSTMSPATASQNAPFMSPNDLLYGMPQFPSQAAFQSNPPTPGSTGPITPNRAGSIDNSQYQFYSSVPTSVNHSRAPSPSLGRQPVATFPAGINSLMSSAMNMSQPNADIQPPSIYKLMPAEYSKAGGIEVSCLGSNFTRNMEVLFGDQLATTTTYWNTQLLVCLLPPAACAGTVPVTIRLNGQPAFNPAALPGPPATFTYIDDDESRIYELAVRILCQKETGSIKNDDLRHFARGIVNRFSSGWSGASGGGHMQQRGNMPPMDTEEALLRVLNLVDMDDSPHIAHFNFKNKSGATMLSLAAGLGYCRVVAGLLARGANPDARDVGGYTPLMMAAMHGHGQIVRRLILRGADPTLRTLQGYLAKDFATTRDVRDALLKVQSHRRTRSAGSASLSMRSRTSSIGSTRSLWESASPSHASDFSAFEADHEDEGEDSEESEEVPVAWTASRRGSAKSIVPSTPPAHVEQPGSIATPQHTWRQNLSAQFHNLQNMHWNMPQLQLPTLPQFPNIPGYQDHPVMQRISSLVPHRSPPRSPSATSDETARPPTESKWRDLFSVSAPPPPAYDEIYPENKTRDLDIKKRSVAQAAADHLLDQACEAEFESAQESEESSTGSSVPKVEFGKKTLTKKQQKRVRRAHAHKMKQMRSDRNLFFIWIPLLLIVLAIMLHSHLDQFLAATSVVVSALKGHPQVVGEGLGTTFQRVVEVP